VITNRHQQTATETPKAETANAEEEEEADDEEEEEVEGENEEGKPIPTLQYNPVDARVKLTNSPDDVRIPAGISRGRTRFGNPAPTSSTRKPPSISDPVATLLDANAITSNPDSLETLSINELESLLQKLTRIPKAKPDDSSSAVDSALNLLEGSRRTTKTLHSTHQSSAHLPMEPRDSHQRMSSNVTFPAEKVLAKYPIVKSEKVDSTSEESNKKAKKTKEASSKSRSEELFGSNNPFLAFDVESGKVYEQKTGRVFRLTPVP
jgi:hypothetical protein